MKNVNQNLKNQDDKSQTVRLVRIDTIYLNKREQGYCDACLKEVQPEKLIRHKTTDKQPGSIVVVISYVCRRCNR